MSSKGTRAPSRNKAFWQKHIQQWKRSGQSKARYCRDHDLNAGTFYNWCSDKAKADKPGSAASVTLLPVTLTKAESVQASSTPRSVITLEHTLGSFRFPVDVPVESIEQWLSAIGRSNVHN